MRARNEERRQLRALFPETSWPRRANRLREFMAAVEEGARYVGELTSEDQQWIDWARTTTDGRDPLMRRGDPMLDTPEQNEPRCWR